MEPGLRGQILMTHDLNRAVRSFLRNPRFFLISAVSIGLGIAAATSIFTFANAMLFRPLPFPRSDRMIALEEAVHGQPVGGSPARLEDWGKLPSVSAVTGYFGESFTMEAGQIPERVPGLEVFGDFFGVLQVQPARGRVFSERERLGKSSVVVISDALWRSRLGSDPNVLGRKIRLLGAPFEIIGVLPPGVRYDDAEIILPSTNQDFPRSARFIFQVVRMRDTARIETLRAEAAAMADRLAQQYPGTDAGVTLTLTSLRDTFGRSARRPLLVLLAAVTVLALMASINVASLFLARIRGLDEEIAVRQALGAGRTQLLRMLFAEGALAAAAGGVLGLIGAVWSVDLLRGVAPSNLSRLDEVRIDLNVAWFALAVTAASAVLSALLPAWLSASRDIAVRLRDGSRGSRSGGGFARLLAGAQIALSLALAIGGGLLSRSVWNLDNRPLGFARERLLTFRLSLPWQTEPDRLAALYTRVLENLRAIPGVEGAALSDRLPLDGDTQSGQPMVPGKGPDVIPEGSRLSIRAVSTDFHRVMQVPLLQGRALEPADSGKRRAVINEAAARAFFRNENPLGRKIGIRWQKDSDRAPLYEIVGVSGNLPETVREARAAPAAYIPFDATFWPLANFVVRVAGGDPAAISADVRRSVAAAGASEPVEMLRSIDAFLATRNQVERLQAWIVGVFAGAAMLLAAVGIFGLVTGSVAARRVEIGIRMALGADPGTILIETMREFALEVVGGVVAGSVIAALLARALKSTLYGVAPVDPITYVGCALLLFAVVLVAALPPARRASLSDPSVVLRPGR